MGMTMSQKILAYKAGMDSVKPGDLIQAKLDMVLANDITAPVAINEFEKADFADVFHKDKIALVLDHLRPTKTSKRRSSANRCANLRTNTTSRIFMKAETWAWNMRCCRKKDWLRRAIW